MTSVSHLAPGAAATVMGLGRFGGGLGVVRFLHACGLRVTVSDLRTAEQLVGTVERLVNLDGVTLHLGEHRESDFLEADLIVVNPAVRPGHPLVEEARRRGVSITSEIALFWQRCRGRIAGVTGTNGKSTTTRLLHHLLQSEGQRCWLGGNIGGSLLPDVDRIARNDWTVLELSSFQLAALDEVRVSPEIAVVTNFAPNHLDWHGTLDAYRHAKQTILRWQRPGDVAVLNGCDVVGSWDTRGARRLFSVDDLPGGWDRGGNPSLKGAHQQQNAAAAVVAARAMGVSEAAILRGLETFVGLPHRLRLAGTREGRRWYDDSASTTPESTLAALASFNEPVVLLVGGADKGVDLSALAEGIAASAKAAILLGAVAGQLQKLLEPRVASARAGSGVLQSVNVAGSLAEAVEQALAGSVPGDVVLLSPGCASYGWFANYVERGLAFAELVGTDAV